MSWRGMGRMFALHVADPIQFPGPHPPAPPGVVSEHEQEYALSFSRFFPPATEINNSRNFKEVDTQRPLCRGCRPCGNLLVGQGRESGCGRLESLVPQVFGFHLPSDLLGVGTLVASGSEREKLSPQNRWGFLPSGGDEELFATGPVAPVTVPATLHLFPGSCAFRPSLWPSEKERSSGKRSTN